MNDILQLKGVLQDRKNINTPKGRNIPKNGTAVTAEQLFRLRRKLVDLSEFWSRQKIIRGCLIDVKYRDVVAKSNRISGFFAGSGSVNDSIVGARFGNEVKIKHVITHYIALEILHDTINRIQYCVDLLSGELGGSIDHGEVADLSQRSIDFAKYGLSKTSFVNIVVDAYYVEDFDIPDNTAQSKENSIVTVYRTDGNLVALMKGLGINILPDKIVGETTMLMYPDEIERLTEKAPFLIAMSTVDISALSYEDVVDKNFERRAVTIDAPSGEPVVGVIDTLFDEQVYFSSWVEYKKMISDEISTTSEDFDHGTSVSSIIVDGPTINPDLDDGCGRFRVKHFGVALHGQYSAFSIMKSIREIVHTNRDIKVWNLSLGSVNEINGNFISPEAAILDQIQSEYDVIFIVAGTNKRPADGDTEKRIGAPADSINSIIVNSVSADGKVASYSRKGLVLSFFNKPDVCSYGGDGDKFIRVCTPLGVGYKCGTSYAAPWVTRKVAFLIEVLGFSREVAKALIVDSAAGWSGLSKNQKLAPFVGFGVVPQRIEDVVKSKDDEIKFVITGTSEKWETFTYNLPVPTHNNRHPFVAKATLCYFPSCSRNQGVDYTNTELDMYFGRVKGSEIKTINQNLQSPDDGEKHYIYEGNARELYRKWDNTKHISEQLTKRSRARDVYGDGLWGLRVVAKERLNKRDKGINFGIVVTLKEIKGVNRIGDFIRQCELRGWLVSRIDVDGRIQIYNKAQQEITFAP